ncbi:MAG TPA: hypothetical protein VMN57_11970 [Anaerolineales bacterium]|nr:hypothetical protein [Anaerolineales bacterium]
MDEIILDTTAAPKVIVAAQERLAVRGWDRDSLQASGPDGSIHVEKDGDAVKVSGSSRVDLRVPRGASLEITGFAATSVRDLTGTVHVISAGNSLTLRGVGAATVGTVDQDLTARAVSGGLTVASVGRYANVRGVEGDVQINHVDSHLNLREIAGNVTAVAGDNANLIIELREGRSFRISAGGVITCRLFPEPDGRVRITNSGPITVKAGGVRETVRDEFEAVFGEGAGELVLAGNGPVTLAETDPDREASSYEFDFNLGEDLSGIGAGIGEQIAEQLGMIEEELEARMSGFSELVETWDLPAEKIERIQRRTQEKVEKAQEKIRRAQERAGRKIADAQRRAEKEARWAAHIERRVHGKAFNIAPGNLRKSDKPKNDPVSDEERLMILNMVADKKISLEEAEALLAALESR